MAKRRTTRAAKVSTKRAKRRPAKRAGKPAAASMAAVARKIVRATQQPGFPFMTLYRADATSTEATGATARGYTELAEKNARWAQFQSSSQWTARNVWTGKNTVCIEWEGDVQTRDGRQLKLTEIAVHEIKDGKIQSERFYYNPGALAPAAS